MTWVVLLLPALVAYLLPSCSSTSDTEVFQNLFTQKRAEQLAAVQQLLAIDQERQDHLIGSMLEKMMEVLTKGRVQLEAMGIVGMAEELPKDETTKNALALVLENTCFLADILLRFPDRLHALFSAKNEWLTSFTWSLSFALESPLLAGPAASAKEPLRLAAQDLGVIPREQDYVNPYKAERKKQKRFDEPPTPKKKEKKKIKKGPRLSKGEL